MKTQPNNRMKHDLASAEISGMLDTLKERKQFIGFEDDDIRELTALKSWGDAHVDRAAENFYDQLKQFDKPMRVIREGGSTLDRLRTTMKQYLLELFDGEYGQDHFRRRYQIGVRHDLIGLTPRWYIGGFSIHFQSMAPMLVRKYWWRPKKLVRVLLALNKILNLDEQIAIDTYFDLRSSKVATTSAEIAHTSKEMSNNVRQQSDKITQTSSSIKKMTASISQVSENAAATMEAAQSATEKARQGAVEIEEATSGIGAANQTVQSLRGRVENVGKVIELIQDIASQTNILALNAAIEAAGAGESGARFNIVAEEIRKLAVRTAEATSEITATIVEIQEDTIKVASVMGDSSRLAGSVGQSINEIVTGIQGVQDMVAQIAAAAEQQARTSGVVADTLIALAQSSEQISVSTEQTALATEDLNIMAEQLRE